MASIATPSFGVSKRKPAPIYVAPRARRGSGTRLDPELDRARKLARILDGYFVDPLLGLVLPGAGDIIGSLLGAYTVVIALRRKTSPVVIARMIMNLAGDALIGVIPLVGDLFDFGFKANQRNVDLLAQRSQSGGKATARDWLTLGGAVLAFVVVIAAVVYGFVRLVHAIF